MINKKLTVAAIILLLAAVFSLNAAAAEFTAELFTELADSVNDRPFIDKPDYSVLKLDNGMTIYLAEDNELPIFELRGYIKGGFSQEKKEESGISSLMTEVMNLGTENYDENELSRFKELNALSFNINSDFDYYKISGSSLSTEKEEMIEVTAEILQNPKFDRDYFARTVNESKQFYRQQFYQDEGLIDMHFYKNIYGEHPYGYQFDYDQILDFLDNVSSKDLEKFYQENINPEQLVLVLSGDFNIEEMEKVLINYFSDWENNESELSAPYVNVNNKNHGRVIVVDKKDATQAKIRMGYNFYSDKFPKKVPFLMGNIIFGSGNFNSRLVKNLRSEKGYVYSINSSAEYHKYGGIYYINLSVDPVNVLSSIDAVKEEMNKVKSAEKPFTKKELFENVNLYNAIFPKAYKENIDVIEKIAYEVELRGNSDQYINRLIEQYNGLESAEVQKIFADNLYPQIIMSVIVGPGDKVTKVLEENNVEYELIN